MNPVVYKRFPIYSVMVLKLNFEKDGWGFELECRNRLKASIINIYGSKKFWFLITAKFCLQVTAKYEQNTFMEKAKVCKRHVSST